MILLQRSLAMYLPALLCRRNGGSVGGLEMEDIDGAALADFRSGQWSMGERRQHEVVNKNPVSDRVQE